MAVLHAVHADNGREFFKVFGSGNPLLMIKRGTARAARVLGADVLQLYGLPVREIVEWCEVAGELAAELREVQNGRYNARN